MDPQEILERLSRITPPFPLAAAQEALARWDELAPLFITRLEEVATSKSALIAPDEYDGVFTFAQYLAAEKRDTRAFLPLLRSCQCSLDKADELFGDDVGGSLGRLLATLCDGDPAPLKTLAEDTNIGMWSRHAGLHALAVRVFEGDESPEKLTEYLMTFCEREADTLRAGKANVEQMGESMLTWAAEVLRGIGPAPLMENIRGWFDEGLIEADVAGLKHFERAAAMSPDETLALARKNPHNRYITSAIDEMRWWYCYEVKTPKVVPAKPQFLSIGDTQGHNSPKVGRNAPCPCGSGKKFKKCCGK